MRTVEVNLDSYHCSSVEVDGDTVEMIFINNPHGSIIGINFPTLVIERFYDILKQELVEKGIIPVND